MSVITPTASPSLANAIRWVTQRGVEVTPVAARPATRGLDPHDHPVLYLVAPHEEPPRSWGELEDWVRLPADPDEVYERGDRLLARAEQVGASWTYVDADDVLRAGTALVPLSPLEAQLVRVLLAQVDEVVSREDLEAALWPAGAPGDTRALDNRLTRLRRRLEGLPVEIHTVRGRGFLLERSVHDRRSSRS